MFLNALKIKGLKDIQPQKPEEGLMKNKYSIYAFCAALALQSLHAKTITVAPELGSSGIINAILSAHDSDIIQLEDGHFQATENIVVDKPLTIRGSNSTRISFDDSTKQILVHANQVHLQNFEILANNTVSADDALIHILAGHFSPLENIFISGVKFFCGGVGLAVAPIKNIHVENCDFYMNASSHVINAISLNHVHNAIIENNHFHEPVRSSVIGWHTPAHVAPPPTRNAAGEPLLVAVQASLYDEALLIKGNTAQGVSLFSINLKTIPDVTQSVIHVKGNTVRFSSLGSIYVKEAQWTRACESLCLVNNTLQDDASGVFNGLFELSSKEPVPVTKWTPWEALPTFSFHASNNTMPGSPGSPDSHITIDPTTMIGVDTHYFSTTFAALPDKKVLLLDPDDQHTMHTQIHAAEQNTTVVLYPGEYFTSHTWAPHAGVRLIGVSKAPTLITTTQWTDPLQPLVHVTEPGVLIDRLIMKNKENGPVTFIVSEDSSINLAMKNTTFYLKESDFALEAVNNILHVEKCFFHVTPRAGMRGGILLYGHPSGYTSTITQCSFDGNTRGDTTPNYRAVFCRALGLPTTSYLQGGLEINQSNIQGDQAFFGELQYTGTTPPLFTVSINENVCHIRESLCMIRTGNDRPLDVFSLGISLNTIFFDEPDNHKGVVSLLGTLYPEPKWMFGNPDNFFLATTTKINPKPMLRTFHGKALIGNDDFFQTSSLEPALTFNHKSFIDSFDGNDTGNGGDLDDDSGTGGGTGTGGTGDGTGGTGGDSGTGGTGGTDSGSGGVGDDLPQQDESILPISFAQGMTVREAFPSHIETIHVLEWVHPEPSKLSHFTIQKSGSSVPLATISVPADAQDGDTFVHVIRAADPNWSHNAYTITAHTPQGSSSTRKKTTHQ